jgi:hypothetical protein
MQNSQAGSLGATRPFAPVSSNFQNASAMPANSTSRHQSSRIVPTILACHQSPHKPTSSQFHVRQGACTNCGCSSVTRIAASVVPSISKPRDTQTFLPTRQCKPASQEAHHSSRCMSSKCLPFEVYSPPSTYCPGTTEKEKEWPRYSSNSNCQYYYVASPNSSCTVPATSGKPTAPRRARFIQPARRGTPGERPAPKSEKVASPNGITVLELCMFLNARLPFEAHKQISLQH